MHLELNRPGRRSRPADRPKRPAHLERRPSSPACVLLAVVEQQQRVAAELEEAAALRVGNAEERRERGIHHLGDLLGPCSAEARETLRHGGEARDVDECEGSLDLAPRCLGLVAEPLQRQPRDERNEVARRAYACIRRRCGHCLILLYGRHETKDRPLRGRCISTGVTSQPMRVHGTFTDPQPNPPEKGTSDTS